MANDKLETNLNVGHLEDEALKRKERLNALKRGELKSLASDESKNKNEEDVSFPKPIFRNYTPKDETLKIGQLPKPNLIEIEAEVKDQLESGKPAPLIEKEIDLATLAPQKIDWDLKRDAEKKLKILEKRTQRAIVDLIRSRLKQEKNTDLAELVSIGARKNLKEDKRNPNDEEDENDDDDDDDDDNEEPIEDRSNSKASKDDAYQNGSEEDPEENQFINDKREISDDDDY
jgi:coiled-coil domain-containing protein 12